MTSFKSLSLSVLGALAVAVLALQPAFADTPSSPTGDIIVPAASRVCGTLRADANGQWNVDDENAGAERKVFPLTDAVEGELSELYAYTGDAKPRVCLRAFEGADSELYVWDVDDGKRSGVSVGSQ